MTYICNSSQLLQTLFIFILQSRRCVCFHLVAMFSDFSCQPWSVVITRAITLSQKVNKSSLLPSYTFDRSIFWVLGANWARTGGGPPQNWETKNNNIFTWAPNFWILLLNIMRSHAEFMTESLLTWSPPSENNPKYFWQIYQGDPRINI